jgi:hypothetical protein
MQALPAARIASALLVCGIVSSLLYATMILVIRFAGYSPLDATVSELSAIGAPTRTLWMILGSVYDALLAAFGLGVWHAARGGTALRLTGALLIAFAALGLIWPFASMHPRAVLAAGGGTFSDTLHLVLVAMSGIVSVAAMVAAAVALTNRFRLYCALTILALLGFGTLTSLDAPAVQANLPTPLVGLWERLNILVFLLWVAVLALALIRREATRGPALMSAPVATARSPGNR